MNDSECKHGECHCKGSDVQSDGYCSDACRSGQTSNGSCACGHPDCK